MQPLNKWHLIHTYHKTHGYLTCPDDNYPYYTMMAGDDDNEPVFHCTFCQSNMRLGSNGWSQILEAVQTVYPNVTMEE